MATNMLESGADLRYIQVMFGRTDMNTAQAYTHISIRKLQEVHAQTHPARLKKAMNPVNIVLYSVLLITRYKVL